MPPKRSTTRATRAAEAVAQDAAAQEETAAHETSTKAQVDGANDQQGFVPLTLLQGATAGAKGGL